MVDTTSTAARAATQQEDSDGIDYVINPVLGKSLEELDNARPSYEKAQDYYDGTQQEVFVSKRLRRIMESAGVDYTFRFAACPVDAVADRLTLSGVTEADREREDDASEKAASDVDSTIERLWDDNDLDLEMGDWFTEALKSGDGYIVVWPEDDTDDTPATVSGQNTTFAPVRRVNMFWNSPLMCRVFYSPDNPREKSHAVRRWKDPDGRWRADLIFRDRIERYVTTSAKLGRCPRTQGWQRFVDDANVDDAGDGQWPLPNPYDQVFVFHLRTARPYGHPEHERFYGPQNAITKLLTGHLGGVDFHALPQMAALMEADGESSEASDVDRDEFAIDPVSHNTDGGDESPLSNLKQTPGSLWELRGVKSMWQSSPALPAVFMDPLSKYLEFGAHLTTTPMRMFVESGQQPSGESQRMSEGPFNKKATNRQTSFGATARDAFECALYMMLGREVSVMVHWAPVQVIDDTQGWSVVEAKQRLGVPRRQTLMETGYTTDQLDDWGVEGTDETDDLGDRVALLTQVGQALSAIGGAVSMGAITTEISAALVAAVLADVQAAVADDEPGEDGRAPESPPAPQPEPAVANADPEAA